jgi:hypothetical protein
VSNGDDIPSVLFTDKQVADHLNLSRGISSEYTVSVDPNDDSIGTITITRKVALDNTVASDFFKSSALSKLTTDEVTALKSAWNVKS